MTRPVEQVSAVFDRPPSTPTRASEPSYARRFEGHSLPFSFGRSRSRSHSHSRSRSRSRSHSCSHSRFVLIPSLAAVVSRQSRVYSSPSRCQYPPPHCFRRSLFHVPHAHTPQCRPCSPLLASRSPSGSREPRITNSPARGQS
jgi:hypothetical protein